MTTQLDSFSMPLVRSKKKELLISYYEANMSF